MFRDRKDAGRQLAAALTPYRQQPTVVYALPRGGVVPGAEVAQSLEAPLDLIVVRKIGHPESPEYAIGAIAEDGYTVMNSTEIASVDKAWFDQAVSAEWNEAQRRRNVFVGSRNPVLVEGKIAIIVDDGLATGLTMEAAIHAIRKRHPRQIIVAVPVAARETANRIRSQVDKLVVLDIPDGFFGAIGAFYRNFDQVSDEEVVAIMNSVASA